MLLLNRQKTSFRASKQPQKFGTQKTVEITRKLPQWTIVLSKWNKCVASNIHLDHSSGLVSECVL